MRSLYARVRRGHNFPTPAPESTHFNTDPNLFRAKTAFSVFRLFPLFSGESNLGLRQFAPLTQCILKIGNGH
ncbi:hypothetical protein EUTSA_v10009270mg [Eutrema salsugineum]|uniref:Uncharacterized protein n=1 Tax=Eutrema salsugineum TaxID=72664 RepID=V4KDS1_EUTSA|nr:hypothetical protein EUTSA_v10009270mg [Eutrema salsugineum]